MAHDVFISHSSLDRDAAYALCDNLEASQVACWIAPRDIPAGSDWQGEIIEAISNTKMMLVLFSQNGNASANVSKEVTAAAEMRVPVIPVRLDDTPPSATLRYHLSGVHWLDAYPPPIDGHLTRIADLVRGRVARIAGPSGQTPAARPSSAPRQAEARPAPAATPTPTPGPAPTAGPPPATTAAPAPVARQAQPLAGMAPAGAAAASGAGYVAAGGGAAAATPDFSGFQPSAPAPKSNTGQWLMIGGILGGLVLVAILLLMFAGPRNNRPPVTPGPNPQVQTSPPSDLEVTDPGQSPPPAGPNAPPATPGGTADVSGLESQVTALYQQVRAAAGDDAQTLEESETQFQSDRTACNGDAGCLSRLYTARLAVLQGWNSGGEAAAPAGGEEAEPAPAE